MESRPLAAGQPGPAIAGSAAGGAQDGAPRSASLDKAGREFERLLVEQMLTAMQASLDEGLFPQEGVGGEWYASLFNQALSRDMTSGQGLGLASSLLQQLRQEGGPAAAGGPGAAAAGDLERALPALPAGLPALNAGLPALGLASLDRAFALRRRDQAAGAAPLGALEQASQVGRTRRASFSRPGDERVDKLRELVREVAGEVGVDERLALALVETESGWDARAHSSKGAMGLTQLMPDTARGLGVRDAFDPRQNLKGGLSYLRDLLERYQDRRLALAAYNAGPGAVDRHEGVPPYKETRAYVSRIEKLLSEGP